MTIKKTEILFLSEDEWKALEAVQKMIEFAKRESEDLRTRNLLTDLHEKIFLFKEICEEE